MNEDIRKISNSSETDESLVRAFKAGNSAAFDRLVIKHMDKLFNLCYRLLGDYQEANDTAQEVFIKIFRSLNKFRFESTFSTWLYRIAVNTCKNRLKSSAYRHRKKMVSLDNPGGSKNHNPSFEIQDTSPSPAVQLEKKERLRLIEKAINSLPPSQKSVVVLRDMEGLSYEEIAEITGLNLGTVKSRLARGRLDLRNKLRGVV